ALKPAPASHFALPISQGLGMMKKPSSCSVRKRARRAASVLASMAESVGAEVLSGSILRIGSSGHGAHRGGRPGWRVHAGPGWRQKVNLQWRYGLARAILWPGTDVVNRCRESPLIQPFFRTQSATVAA